MKKLIQKISSVTLLFISVVTLNAQNVGINATGAAPSGDAMLDIAATNKGLLVPRVNIANLATIAPITGGTTTSLLVYNTNATTGLGYYYWDGAAWVKFTTGGDDWKIIGNANITGGTHFLGTTNNVQLDFRTSNATRFSVKSNGDQVFAAGDGTNALPFYSWGTDPDIGMYRITTNTLGFATSAVERFRMSTTEAVFNDISANYDFRIESNNQANIFFVDAGNDRVGVRTAAPGNMFHVTNGGVNVGASGMAFFQNLGADGVSVQGRNTSTTSGYNASEFITDYSGTAFLTAGMMGLAIYQGAVNCNSIGVRAATNEWQGTGIYASRFNSGGANSGWGGQVYNDLGYTGFFGAISDERTKKDIKQIKGALSIIDQLNPVTYHFDLEKYPTMGLNEEMEYGFIAQEVRKVLPEVTRIKGFDPNACVEIQPNQQIENKRELFVAMDYTRIIPILTKGIQEQQTMIEIQNAKIEALEKMVLELKNK